MSVAPNPDKIHDRAEEEDRRRLSMPLLGQPSTAFIAGVTRNVGLSTTGNVGGGLLLMTVAHPVQAKASD